MTTRKNIVFFHPDLGIGGAERLVIDAAVGLQNLGHQVTIFTSHCDHGHCFDEARDGTLDVRVRGGWLFPPTLFARFHILMTILRHYHLLIAILVTGELARLRPGVFFVDQLSAGVPFLRWRWPGTRVLFYCHYPDFLLVRGRGKWWRGGWRWGFDRWEEWGMRGADGVVVNSAFTKGVVEGVWRGVGGERGVRVVYPCVDVGGKEGPSGGGERGEALWKGKKVVLSINRFERKKGVGLAIKAYAGLGGKGREDVRLVIAGGYDNRVQENASYHNELVALAESLSLKTATAKNIVTALNIPDDIDVLFLLSVPAQLKSMLLNAASLLVYTPSNEHFGIVPLEAMLAGVPVLAANSGGPLETIVDGETGWLRPIEDVEQWTELMRRVLFHFTEEHLRHMGDSGRKRVEEEFSEIKMAWRLDEEIEALVTAPRVETTEIPDVLLVLGVLGLVAVAVIGILYKRVIQHVSLN